MQEQIESQLNTALQGEQVPLVLHLITCLLRAWRCLLFGVVFLAWSSHILCVHLAVLIDQGSFNSQVLISF